MYSFLPLIILIATSICKGQHEKKCDVFPKDQFIEVGSNASIECQSCGHGKIFWTLNNERVDESFSNTISSTRTSLTLRNFTHPSATLQCHSVDTDLVLGGTTIKTYSKPSKISCTWHYENQIKGVGVPEMLTCSWEHQMNSPMKINYTVLCAGENCSSDVKNCTFPEMADKIVENISVTVRAKTAAWEVSSDPQIFNPYHILKIAPPKLKVTATSNHLSVTWNRSPLENISKSRCEVKCKAANERTPEWVLNKTLNPEDSRNVTITKVESCAYYNISVRCALDQAPWSDWSQEMILTKLNKSNVKLHLWRKVAEPGKNGVRKVYLMWTEIPSTCQGTFTYTIKLGVNHTDTLCGNSTCDVDVNQDAYRLNLTVFHNEALLEEESVYVPAIGESLPQVTDMKASSLDGVVLVRWKAPLEPVSGYMIDWTHNGNQYYWKQSKYTNITLFDLLHKKPYNITVTPLFDDKTGHGTQALQICSRVGDPGKFTNIDIHAKDKSATVSWKLDSQECSGVVVNYTVFYRAMEGPLINVTVDHTEPKISLTDLNPETEYSVYVEAIALTGTTKSSETSFNTKKFDPTFITALGVCGSIIILVVLSLGLCCAIQWKKFKEKPVPNPSLSSVALWPPPNQQKGTSSFQPFSNPSESYCERIFMEDTERTSTPQLAIGCNPHLNPASDQREEHAQPAITPAADIQDERPVESVETLCDSPGESTALLCSDKPLNPYRCQISVETPPSRNTKQSKHLLPEKQQEKTVTVYVTLDMFEQGQCRLEK
ncbi:interleukin-31 receptor subunit alpha-like [Scomber scombrus]|uniref:interleukin-31 receptor subunit alpha-like n=1 Tax=Scomber scombrus TaxID=13677 RepID=UPI002DD8C5F8|nr:interleukin-31 receptor subunit alpha-like [Scomber scombrus]